MSPRGSISDRGDDYFDKFDERYDALIAQQETGIDAYYVLVEADGSVIGRFNLVDIGGGSAELGYRVAQRVAGHGVATASVREVCRLAASQLGLLTLKARTTPENIASQKVLARAGFIPTGDADVGGRPGAWYRCDLGPETA